MRILRKLRGWLYRFKVLDDGRYRLRVLCFRFTWMPRIACVENELKACRNELGKLTAELSVIKAQGLSAAPISESPVDYARRLGVAVGKRTRITCYPKADSHPLYGSEPYLIEIGDDCLLSFGITFLTHDGSIRTSHFQAPEYGLFSQFGRIKIGKECFIGCHVIIMPGVTIGDRCVIGAGSIVTKDIPAGEVWAGNPAQYITTVEALSNKQYNRWLTQKHKELENIVAAKRGGMAIQPREAFFTPEELLEYQMKTL